MRENSLSNSVDIFHNIVWPKYIGEIFTKLHHISLERHLSLHFTHVADTETERASLGSVDYSYHSYPYEVMFSGAYSKIPRFQLYLRLAKRCWVSDARLLVLPGYHLPEHWIMLLVSRCRGKKVAVFCDSTAADNKPRAWKTLAKKVFFRSCSGIFCYGENGRKYIKSFGVNTARIFSGCQASASITELSPSKILEMRVRDASSDFDRPVFLFVGRLSNEKGLTILLKAFYKLLSKFPHSSLRIAGDGPQRKALEQQVSFYHIGSSVTFLGALTPELLGQEYLSARSLVLPSNSEPWGLVVNEAMSFGCPSIVSDKCGCIPELVTAGVTGVIFESRNSDDLCQKMEDSMRCFFDVGATAANCLDRMSNYTAEAAALRMAEGMLSTLEN